MHLHNGTLMFLRKEALKKCWSFSDLLFLPADINENYVSTAEKGGDAEVFANVPVMFCDKGIKRGVQMLQIKIHPNKRAPMSPALPLPTAPLVEPLPDTAKHLFSHPLPILHCLTRKQRLPSLLNLSKNQKHCILLNVSWAYPRCSKQFQKLPSWLSLKPQMAGASLWIRRIVCGLGVDALMAVLRF
jgi:hypothetical protein